MRNPDRKVLVLWLIVLAMITWREVKDGDGMPRPSAYVPSSLVFALAAVLAELSGPLAVAIAAGWTVNVALTLAGGASRRDTEGAAGGRGEESTTAPDADAAGGPSGSTAPRRRRRRRRAPTLQRRRAVASAARARG